MKGYNFKSIKNKYKKYLLFMLTFIVTYTILISSLSPKKYDLSAGEIARSDIKAPREMVDEEASEEKLQAALESIDKQFTLKSEVKKQAESNIMGLIDKAIEVLSENGSEVSNIENLKKYDAIKLDDSECKILLGVSKESLIALKDDVSRILNDVYEKNIPNDDSKSLEEAKEIAVTEISELQLSNEVTNLLDKIFENEIKPNFFYDEEKTDEKIKEVQKNSEKVLIKKNQTIVKDGDQVTERQIEILKELGLLNENSGKGFTLLYIAVALLVGIVLYIEHYYIYENNKEIFYDIKKLTLINVLNILTLILGKVVGLGTAYIIPLACSPILITLLINYKISLFVSTINVILVGCIVEFEPAIVVLAIVNAVLGSTMLKKMQQRNDILYASIWILTLVGIVNFSIGVILSSNTIDILINTIYSILGVIISGILAIGLLPILEGAFDIVTTLKLLELSNPNSPLLKRLLMEAPGTYNHSIMVANLAEMAAEEVSADPVIARVGAYYHDVGKILRPYFFKENQLTKENPHDKINPTLSTLIITSHVKDGLELAKEYKLPKVLQDIIVQHHGTTLVKYFYLTVKNNSENPDEIKEDDFRYPGPIPSSKESGIIMLADSTEAAVRSITDPTKGKIEEMVNNIINDKLYSGQLDNCDLTLKDLSKIRTCFLKALNGIYHQRIEYPSDKIKELDKKDTKLRGE